MHEHSLFAKAFPVAASVIQGLRREDKTFDEVCRDFLELSELLERLSASGEREGDALAALVDSLEELKIELAEYLKSPMALELINKARGDET